MNDLSGTVRDQRPPPHCCCCFSCDSIPAPVHCVLVLLFLAGLGVFAFILAVVHNAWFLASFLVLSAIVFLFLLWNAFNSMSGAALLFLDRFPDSDLLTATDGQLVKITGFASCESLSLESSYEKVRRCVYTSTLLYEYRGIGSQQRATDWKCFQWNLAYSERFTADFYITDVKSGMRAMVKAGCNSKVISLIDENTLVKTDSQKTALSSTLIKWLEERYLSAEARVLCLEEGYVREGSSLTVMGILSRNSGIHMIVPPREPISTGFLLRKFLLPTDIDGLVLRVSD